MYAARLPPAFHSFKHLRFSLTASSTRLFHHQVCFLHGWFEETPHTCFVACKSLSFSEVQRSSTVLVCDSSLSSGLALNTSESSACFTIGLLASTPWCVAQTCAWVGEGWKLWNLQPAAYVDTRLPLLDAWIYTFQFVCESFSMQSKFKDFTILFVFWLKSSTQ